LCVIIIIYNLIFTFISDVFQCEDKILGHVPFVTSASVFRKKKLRTGKKVLCENVYKGNLDVLVDQLCVTGVELRVITDTSYVNNSYAMIKFSYA